MKVGAASSAKSLRSRRSVVTERGGVKYEGEYTKVKDFEECFPDICRRYGLVRPLHVKKEFVRDEYFKNLQQTKTAKRKHITVSNPPTAALLSKTTLVDDNATIATTASTEFVLDEDTLTIAAMYDNCNRFVELFFYKLDETPRELILLIGFVARYYYDLKRIKIQFCKIDAYTIYELSKLVCVSSITEVDLDGSTTSAGNYGLLLDNARVANISLSKCNINDRVCEIIASKLCFQGPADRSLYCLNLSSNRITDAGAKCLGNALRTNRTLRYLNLSGNRITDVGAGVILDSLKEFPLTREESLKKSQRYMSYERKRLAIYFKYLNDYENKSTDEINKMRTSDRKKSFASRKSSKASPLRKETKKDPKTFTYEDYKNRAEVLAGEMMGPFHDPFQCNFIKIRDNKCHSMGNMTLCYLNLAYNNLGYHSVVKLLDVLKYQKDTKRLGQIGLMRVILIGNNLPINCEEYVKADELLNKCMISSGGRAFTDFSARRKSRLSRASMMPEKALLEPK